MSNDLKTVWGAKDLIMGGLAYTVMGILIVFLILIIIMAVIKAMAVISGEKKPQADKKADKQNSLATQEEACAPQAVEPQVDDGELIAVITAAIAAMTGQNASGLVVRSYKKTSGNAWNKAGRMDVLDNRL